MADLLTDTERAWLAGLFEGEGWISLTPSGAVVGIVMTDRDVVERVDRLWPSPSGVRIRKGQNGHKEQYRWCLSRRRLVRTFLRSMQPFMFSRRATKAQEAIEHIDALERARSTWRP